MSTIRIYAPDRTPFCVDLFCGLGGWTEGFLAEGWRVVGFDIECHRYDGQKYPAQLVLQDALTIHGSQFHNADCIVASPPCQSYSWLAMPWSRSKDPNNSKAAKALRAKWEAEGPDNRLFDACFRIQREAIEAAGRFIPLIVENVRGTQPWVGRSAWNFGNGSSAFVPIPGTFAWVRMVQRNSLTEPRSEATGSAIRTPPAESTAPALTPARRQAPR